MVENFEIDITPSVTTYELYQIASYTHWFSIGEFIDNSLTSAIRNRTALEKIYGVSYRLRINIELDHENSTIRITDNAAGISRIEMKRALRAGEAPSDTSLLSVHGVGMKMSAFWLGRNLNIQTWPLNENVGFEVEVDLDKIRETRSAKSNVYSIPKAFESGTIITISKISDSKWPMGRGQGKLRSLLASMYRLYLNDPDFPVEINFNGKALSFSELRVLKEPFWPNTQGPQKDSPVIEWERYFTFKTTNGHQIGGRVALLERMSRDVSGFFLHFRGKGMGGIGAGEFKDSEFGSNELKDNREYYRPQSIFGQEGSYRYQRFTGEFDITELGKTSSTDSIKWNEDEQHEFLIALEEFLKDREFNMWAMAENYQSRKAASLLASGDSDNGEEFTIKEVDEISRKFLDSIRPETITHEELESRVSEPEGHKGLKAIPDSEFLVSSNSWKVRDSVGHLHEITPEFIEDSRLELFNLVSSSDTDHQLRINIGHPFFRRFQWGNKDVRLGIISMIYLMAMPEVLLPLRCSNTAFKSKIFEIVESTLQLVEGDI